MTLGILKFGSRHSYKSDVGSEIFGLVNFYQ